MRPLGIPTVKDRIAHQATVIDQGHAVAVFGFIHADSAWVEILLEFPRTAGARGYIPHRRTNQLFTNCVSTA
jgi:hypothetical protein